MSSSMSHLMYLDENVARKVLLNTALVPKGMLIVLVVFVFIKEYFDGITFWKNQ